MIKEICLTNWKSHRESTLFIDPITVLIGTNASGKSNILDALHFLGQIALGKQIAEAVKGDKERGGVRGGFKWLVRQGSETTLIRVRLESSIDTEVEYQYEIQVRVKDESRAEVVTEYLEQIKNNRPKKLFYTAAEHGDSPSIRCYYATGKQGKGKPIDLTRTRSILSQSVSTSVVKEVKDGVHDVLNQLQGIFILEPIPAHMRQYSSLSDRLESDGSNISGVLGALPKDRREETEEELTKYLGQLPENQILKVWSEPVGKFQTDAMLYCQELWRPGKEPLTVDTRGMSDGTLRFLAIMTAMLTMQKGSLLVIEEIDNGLHPWKAELLVKFVKEVGFKRGVDIVCSTHNPALLDALGIEMIPFISLVYREEQTGDSTIKLIEDLKNLPRLLARGSVGKLASSGILNQAVDS